MTPKTPDTARDGLLPCPKCGGKSDMLQTGREELTIKCIEPLKNGLTGCGIKYVQKSKVYGLNWLRERMFENWNTRTPPPATVPGEVERAEWVGKAHGWKLIEEVLKPEDLAAIFHEFYEQLAPSFGYETRKESAVKWADVPEKNKRLMTAVSEKVLAFLCRNNGVERAALAQTDGRG